MSNFDSIWTEQQNQFARKAGWQLCTVFDNGSTAPHIRIFSAGAMTDHKASQHVLDLARAGDGLAISAIRAVMQSRVQPAKARRKK